MGQTMYKLSKEALFFLLNCVEYAEDNGLYEAIDDCDIIAYSKAMADGLKQSCKNEDWRDIMLLVPEVSEEDTRVIKMEG